MIPEVQEILTEFDKGWGEKKSALDQAIAKLRETPIVSEVLPKEQKVEKAEMEREGVLGGLTGWDVQGIPVGQAVVGGFAAVFVTELVDGLMVSQSNVARGVVKLIVAGVGARWGKRLLGDTGAKAITLLIAFDAIRDLIPIDTWAKRASTTVSGVIPTRGLAQGSRSAVRQAEEVASNYSRSIFGR